MPAQNARTGKQVGQHIRNYVDVYITHTHIISFLYTHAQATDFVVQY